ncbi:MAG: polysaccharide biosynthesis tyrosine autokinase [Verrucomicrobiota bacterium]
MNKGQNGNSDNNLQAVEYWQVIKNRYGVILLTFLLVFMTAAVITHILPEKFPGRVVLEIEQPISEMSVIDPNQVSNQVFASRQFLETQFEIISSKMTLYKVVDQLNLAEEWDLPNATAAFGVLRKNLSTEPIRGTDLIEIEYLDTDRGMASRIANAIGETYKERRLEGETKRMKAAVEALDDQLRQQEEKVAAARIKMHSIMKDYRIVDLSAGNPMMSDGEPISGKQSTFQQSLRNLQDKEDLINEITTQINTLSNLEGEELIRSAASLDIQDDTIRRLFPEYQQLILAEQEALEVGLGRRHPTVQGIRRQLATTRDLLSEGVDSVKKNLQTQLEIAQENFAKLEDSHDRREEEVLAERVTTISYTDAKREFENQKDILQKMTFESNAKKIDLRMPKVPVVFHERAEPAVNPSTPNVALNLVLGAVVGMVFGLGIAFFLEYMDTSVKSLEDVEKYLEVPVLAVIPKDVGVLHKQSGLSPDAEAYRILRTNIEFNRKSADANSITVVSGGAGEGKSTTLVNLAYVCAQGGYNTLMIDGDLRRPKLHTFFEINNAVGLTNYLTTELMLEDVILQTPIDNLYFMPSGILPADAAGILNSRRMSELITDVKQRFDLVLVDSPPILGVSDASVLASEVDLTMVVIQHRKLPRTMLQRVKKAVENVGGTLLGVVLNNVDIRSDSQYQYYTSYYTYYAPTSAENRPSRSKEKAEEKRAGQQVEEISVDEDAY